jgi:hypothetical protein
MRHFAYSAGVSTVMSTRDGLNVRPLCGGSPALLAGRNGRKPDVRDAPAEPLPTHSYRWLGSICMSGNDHFSDIRKPGWSDTLGLAVFCQEAVTGNLLPGRLC